jgi:hypothetical protein
MERDYLKILSVKRVFLVPKECLASMPTPLFQLLLSELQSQITTIPQTSGSSNHRVRLAWRAAKEHPIWGIRDAPPDPLVEFEELIIPWLSKGLSPDLLPCLPPIRMLSQFLKPHCSLSRRSTANVIIVLVRNLPIREATKKSSQAEGPDRGLLLFYG